MATVVAIITSMVAANATQTITTPNAAFITYNLAGGTSSAPITPVTNKSVLVMGCCTTAVAKGVGQVSLLHVPTSGMTWVGLESANAAATFGVSSTPGTHIVWIDSTHHVDIQVAGADTILVHSNIIGVTLAGNVTLIW